MSNQNEAAVTLTASQLKEMFVEMAKEIRRPADPTPEQLAQKENDRASRRSNAEGQLELLRQKRALQKACTHTRPGNGSSTCVYVYAQANQPNTGHYVICQQCQAMIHPEPRPTGPLGKDLENHIFDTGLFNIHYQKAMASATTF